MTDVRAANSDHLPSTPKPEPASLSENDARFRLVLEASSDGFIILESIRDAAGAIADFRIAYSNPVAANWVNRRPDDLYGQSLLQVFPDCKTSGIFDRYVTVAETGVSATFETFYESQDLTGWFRNVVVKLDDGIAVSFTNITDRKQSELALQQQEQHFRIALQTAKLGSWEHDLRTGVLTCSAQCKANFGLPPDAEFTHETLFQALHPDDQPLVQAAIQRSIEEHRDYEVEERCYHPDGSLHWLVVRGQLVYDAQGMPIRLVGVTLDITKLKQFEDSLRAANQRVSSILESITDAFVAFDRDWRYIYANQEAVRILGRSPQELLGQRWQEVFPGVAQQNPVIMQQFQRAIAEQTTVRFEAFSLITNCWLDISLFPSPDGLAMYFRDISRRKRAEQRRDVQYAIARILAEANTITEAAPAILQALCENLDWQIGVLWGVAADRSVLHFIHCWQSPHVDVQKFAETNQQTTFSQGVGLPGRTWASRQPCWIDNLLQDHNFPRAALASQVGLQSAVGFPILLGDEVLGVIECFSDRLQAPDADLLQMMAAIGSQIGQFMERERTETELQERETELRLITNTVPVLIAFVDAAQRYRFNNQQYEEWFGKPAVEINGKYLWEVFGEAVYETLRPYVERVLAGQEVTFETRIPYKAGIVRDAIVNYVPRFDAQGNVEGFVALVNDITHRKQAEENLLRYQLLSEYSRDIVFYCGQDGHILEANQAAVQAYGYDRAELLTLKIADLRAPETLSVLSQQFEQASKQGILFETIHRRKDGSHFPVEVSAQSAVIDGEKVVLSVIRDITERKHAEVEREQLLVREQMAREAAEAAEQRAQFLAEASKVLTSSLDFECTIKSVAQAIVPTLADWCAVDILKEDGTLERLATTHVDPTKVEWGIELYRRYPPDLNAPHGVAQVLRTGQSEYYPTISDDQIIAAARDTEHLRILREIGFSSVMLVPLNARGKTLGAISLIWAESGRSYSLDDLSLAEELARRAAIALDNARLYWEAQQARQTEQQARAEAERANRVKDEFLAVLSHELRSPLNPILGWSKLLQTDKLDEIKTKQALATIERNAKLQAELIEDLLDVSRILQGKLSLTVAPTNLVSTINAAIETVRLAAEAKGIDLRFTILESGLETSDHPKSSIQNPKFQIIGDSTRLQQVIWNLLSNAIKFTQPGGRVEVRLESFEFSVLSSQLEDPPQNSKLKTQNSYARITVTDTGKGINPNFLPYVFDYFRQEDGTTTRKFGGLGLGLAIVRYLTELHGGTVKVESPGEGLGATFTVSLPLSTHENAEKIGEAQFPSPVSKPSPLSKLRILVVDDEADMRDLMATILEQTGAEIKVVPSAIAALKTFDAFQPDILISDVGMPEVDGYMLIRQIRRLPPEQRGQIPAIALTAYAGAMNQHQALAAGFQKHIAKPVEPEALIEAIITLIQK